MKSVIKKYGVIVGGLGVSPVGVVSGWLLVWRAELFWCRVLSLFELARKSIGVLSPALWRGGLELGKVNGWGSQAPSPC